MIQDRCLVSTKIKLKVIYALSNGYDAHHLWKRVIPETTPVSTFCDTFHVFIVDEHKDFASDT